ncbi:HK97 gp10 family phage protein [Streptacidiphilus sp. N1-12]|uniref:HK97 gp10 family phage protein n=2 Tax=Streptacidiphilus alkalitolerans TaxID=3342712 RepID=A0ABV6WEE1_9ACTN
MIDQVALQQLLRGPHGPVVRLVNTQSRAVANAARRIAPAKSGRLRSTIGSNVTVEGTRVIGRIGSPLEYALYRHEGTGIYGPKGTPIVPVSAKFLRFPSSGTFGPLNHGQVKASGAGTIVYARSVRGVPRMPFLVYALEATVPYPIRINPM